MITTIHIEDGPKGAIVVVDDVVDGRIGLSINLGPYDFLAAYISKTESELVGKALLKAAKK